MYGIDEELINQYICLFVKKAKRCEEPKEINTYLSMRKKLMELEEYE